MALETSTFWLTFPIDLKIIAAAPHVETISLLGTACDVVNGMLKSNQILNGTYLKYLWHVFVAVSFTWDWGSWVLLHQVTL